MQCIVVFTGPAPQINAGRLESIQRDVTMMLRGDKFSSMRGDVPPLIGHTTVSSATKSSLCWQILAKTVGPNYRALRL
jgi:hypothetical protein